MNARATLVVAVLVLASCGGDEVASTTPSTTEPPATTAAPTVPTTTTAAPTTVPPVTTAAPVATAPPATAPPTTAPPTTSPPVTASPTVAPTTVPVASCDPAELLDALNGLYTGNPLWVIVDVTIGECQNGYARVFAIPDMSSCPDPAVPCLESEQVFFQDVDGDWTYIDSGTGIECTDTAGLLPATVDACVALGY